NRTNGTNSSPGGATGSNSADSRRGSNRISTTRPVTTRANESPTINCIKTDTNKRALIPAIDTDPCSDITVIQQSCVPADSVIHPWTDGEFQVVDHEIRPIVPNYEKRKTEELTNNVKPLNKKDKVKIAKLDLSEIRENRPKNKLMLRALKGNETSRKDLLDLLISARAETANNVCERHLANEPGFEFHRRIHSFVSGGLVLYDWTKQCDCKLTIIFKGPLMIVRPVTRTNKERH
ncbi:hypothetical protein AVEN_54361-2-1, partial [Araneus ventricosus]